VVIDFNCSNKDAIFFSVLTFSKIQTDLGLNLNNE